MAVNPKRFIYVGGLDMQVDAPTLTAAFIPFGEIVDVQIPLDLNTKRNRGYGFVEFELPEDAAAAVDNMNNSELFGKMIRCNIAKPQQHGGAKAVWAEDRFHEQKEDSSSSTSSTTTI